MDVKNLINWRQLSLYLSGNEVNIRKNKVPYKYEYIVNDIINAIDNVLKKHID
jgi:hypothetical protein